MPRALDVGAQVPHGAVRAYVMGERGAKNEPATADDIAAMAAIVRDGIAAGALGFTTSRTLLHRAIDGEPVPGTFAARRRAARHRPRARRARTRRVRARVRPDARGAGARVDGAALARRPAGRSPSPCCRTTPIPTSGAACSTRPTQPRRAARISRRRSRRGPTGLLIGLQSTLHPFVAHADVPGDRATCRSRSASRGCAIPECARRILAEQRRVRRARVLAYLASAFHKLFPLGDPPDYEPPAEASVAAIARRARASRPRTVAYDLMLEHDGRELLYFPFLNYSDYDLDAIREMLLHPRTRSSASPTAARTAASSATPSTPTFLLTHWVRDRQRGARLPLEQRGARQTRDTARALRPARSRRARARA